MSDGFIIGAIIILSIILGYCIYRLYIIIQKQKVYNKYLAEVDKFIDETEKNKKKLKAYLDKLDKKTQKSDSDISKVVNEIKKIQRRQNT